MSKIIPFEVKETLKELRNKANKFVTIVDDEKSLITFQGKSDYNSFFFKVTGYKMFDGTETATGQPIMGYDIHYLPYSASDSTSSVNKQYASGTIQLFEIWLKLVSDHIAIDNNQDFDFGNSEFSHNSIALEPAKQIEHPIDEATTTPIKLSIYERISTHGLYKLTDHKLISMLVYALIGIALIFIAKYIGVFKYFNP